MSDIFAREAETMFNSTYGWFNEMLKETEENAKKKKEERENK